MWFMPLRMLFLYKFNRLLKLFFRILQKKWQSLLYKLSNWNFYQFRNLHLWLMSFRMLLLYQFNRLPSWGIECTWSLHWYIFTYLDYFSVSTSPNYMSGSYSKTWRYTLPGVYLSSVSIFGYICRLDGIINIGFYLSSVTTTSGSVDIYQYSNGLMGGQFSAIVITEDNNYV